MFKRIALLFLFCVGIFQWGYGYCAEAKMLGDGGKSVLELAVEGQWRKALERYSMLGEAGKGQEENAFAAAAAAVSSGDVTYARACILVGMYNSKCHAEALEVLSSLEKGEDREDIAATLLHMAGYRTPVEKVAAGIGIGVKTVVLGTLIVALTVIQYIPLGLL